MCLSVSLIGRGADIAMRGFNIAPGSTATANIEILPSTDESYSVSGFQFDLVLPASLSLVSVEAGDACAGFNVESNLLADGTVRVVEYGDGMTVVASGAEGSLVSLELSCAASTTPSEATIAVTKAMFSTSQGEDVPLGDVSAVVSIRIEADGVELNVDDLTLLEGQTFVLEATVSPEDTTYPQIVWSSADEKVATVGSDGLVRALKAGSTEITAQCGEVSAVCLLTVVDASDLVLESGGRSDALDGNDVHVYVEETVSIGVVLPEALTEVPDLDWTLDEGGDEFVKLEKGEDSLNADFTGVAEGQTSYTLSLNGTTLIRGKVTVTKVASGIDSVEAFEPFVPVYNLQGVHLQGNYTEETLSDLPSGIYIVRGKKILVK